MILFNTSIYATPNDGYTNGIGEIVGQVLAYIKEGVVFEIGERTEVVAHKYCHYLTMAQLSLAVTVTVAFVFQTKFFLTLVCKIPAKLTHP